MMPAIKKVFDLIGDYKVELPAENDALKNKIGSYDEKWVGESKSKVLKQIDDEKKASLIKSRMQKQQKTSNKWLIHLIINCGESEFDNFVSKKSARSEF